MFACVIARGGGAMGCVICKLAAFCHAEVASVAPRRPARTAKINSGRLCVMFVIVCVEEITCNITQGMI